MLLKHLKTHIYSICMFEKLPSFFIHVYYYHPFSAQTDPAKLYNDLKCDVPRPQGFEAVMHMRCSQGIQVQEYHGNFCKQQMLTTLGCLLLHKWPNKNRVTALSLRCTNMLNNIFRSADLDTQFVCMINQAARTLFTRTLSSPSQESYQKPSQPRGRKAVASTSFMKSSRKEISEASNKELFENAVNQEWEYVVDICKKYLDVHMTKITSSGQTALHVAVSEGTVKVVKELLEHIKRDYNPVEVLNSKTEKGGYTPLHFATSEDGVKGYLICRLLIGSVDGVEKASKLVRACDGKGETPIFKAIHYGRLQSFLYLQSIVGENEGDLSFW